MADYKGIKGFKVQYLSADPSNPIIGQTWYNDTSKDLKYTEFQAASWATATSLPTAVAGNGLAGTQTASVSFGGYVPPGATAISGTNNYNGTSWTSSGSLPTGIRNCAAAGTQTAGLSVGGVGNPGGTLEYNGSSWSPSNNMISITVVPAQSAGLQTAALAHNATNTELYDGTSWTASNAPVDGKIQGFTLGTQTAALSFGGEPITNVAEIFDGTSWTAIASLNTPVQSQGGFGTASLALSAGGSPPPSGTGATELYDGSTWSSDATMNTARSQVYGSGSVSAGLLAGGFTASPSTAVEEYTGAGPVTKTITVS
jgi:hypothetical protein